MPPRGVTTWMENPKSVALPFPGHGGIGICRVAETVRVSEGQSEIAEDGEEGAGSRAG